MYCVSCGMCFMYYGMYYVCCGMSISTPSAVGARQIVCELGLPSHIVLTPSHKKQQLEAKNNNWDFCCARLEP